MADTTCPYCGDLMAANRKQCGKSDCKRLHNNARQRQFQANYKANHGVRYEHAKYQAKRTAYQRTVRSRGEYPDWKRRADQKRRAQKKGATAVTVSPSKIFERDGWVCGVCNQPVDRTLTYPDRMSASLDHIVPLSQGGAHTETNTRCSHLDCNVKRGNRGGGEQPRLVG